MAAFPPHPAREGRFPFPLPDGWFQLAYASDLTPGEVDCWAKPFCGAAGAVA
jgi:hypothetical protein